MKVTHVPIQSVKENRRENITVLLAVFVFGTMLGSAVVLFGNGQLRFPSLPLNQQLGAVVLARVTATTSPSAVVVSPSTTPLVSSEKVAQLSQELTVNAATVRAAKQTRAELLLEIRDRTIAIDRLNLEIERVKNASVALVTAFDQNCGTWTDTCAAPYTEQLDESNASYNELVSKRSAVSLDLTLLENELYSLPN